MAKKATLLKRAQKLGLEVTEKSTVPEITAALDAHEAQNKPAEPAQGAPAAPEAEKTVVEPVEPETPVEDAVAPEMSLKDLLMIYNSIVPSRRRWINNRNHLRQHWKELFVALEQLSGRTGQKADIYDPNWHKLIDKGGVDGPTNKEKREVTIVTETGENLDETTATQEASETPQTEATTPATE